MCNFIKASILSYIAVLVFFYGVAMPALMALAYVIDPITNELYIWTLIVLNFIIPPFVGIYAYLFVSKRIGNLYIHPLFAIPYYVALYQVSNVISMGIISDFFQKDSYSVWSYEMIPYYILSFIFITMMMYVITPRPKIA